MNITTNDDWQEAGEYMFATTSDPRVVAVIQRDDDVTSMKDLFDGDTINPVIYVDHCGSLSFTHAAGFDGGEADLMQRAYEQWGWNGTARRYLWIFHGIAADNAWGGYDRNGNYIVATSRTYRENVGLDEPTTYAEAVATVESMREEVSKALDGDVYGVGFAINEARVLKDDEPIDLEDGDWEISLESWGYIGERYAQEEAGSFASCSPDLPALLDFEVSA